MSESLAGRRREPFPGKIMRDQHNSSIGCVGKRLRCAPANSSITRGRGVRKPIDRLLRPLALGAWTYATGSPTPKGLGSCSERPAALLVYRGFDTPGRCVPVPPPSSVIPNAYGNRHPRQGSPPALRLLRILRFPPQRPVPAATRPYDSCALTRTHKETKPR